MSEPQVYGHVRKVDRAEASSNGGDERGRSFWFVSAVVTVAYAALGALALWLGQMTGLASPVWPAAGVAFAAAAIWGAKAWPGIAVGSFSVNFFWLITLEDAESYVWVTALAIAVGATLQAAAGAALVHRFVGRRLSLDAPRNILLTLLLAGPVAVVVAPTIAVSAQLATGVLSLGAAPMGWLTWWVGDAIGVVVFAPLMLMLIPSQSAIWDGRRWLVAVPSILIVGALITVILQNAAYERERAQTAVERLSDEAAAALMSNIDRHQESLEGLRGLIDASEDVTFAEFSTYTDDVLARFPNLQAISWNPLILRDDLVAFEESQRAQPGLEAFIVTERDADGNLVPVSSRPEYVVVAYIKPLALNRNALGFDIYSNPTRAVAIEEARDTAEAIATAPIDLVQESGSQKGMLALLPVYEGGTDPGTIAERRAQLKGFTVGVYRLGDLLEETFSNDKWDAIDIQLLDVTDDAAGELIADLPARTAGDVDQISQGPTATTRPLDVYGRMWELTVTPQASVVSTSTPLTVTLLFSSLGVAFLLEALLLLLSGLEARARREAEISSYEANHDPLTELQNRRSFVREFGSILSDDARTRSVALLFCDLDRFKEVNDTGGHEAGDAMLAAVAWELRHRVRHDDLVARMGGDEFAIVLRDCSESDAQHIAQSIIDNVAQIRLPEPNHECSVGISIGLAMVEPGSTESLDEHLRLADQASYIAKAAGGSRIVSHTEDALS